MRRALVLLLMLAAAGAAPRAVPAAPAGPDRSLVVRVGRAVFEDGREIAPAELLVVDGRIRAIGGTVEAPRDAEVVDQPDAVLAPGFVDAHAWLDRAEELGEPVRADAPDLDVLHVERPGDEAFAAQRAAGVTLTLFAPGDGAVIGGRPALFASDGRVIAERVGLKAAVGGPALSADRFPSSRWGALDLLRASPAVAALAEGGGPLFLRAPGAADAAAALRLLAERKGVRAALVGGGDLDRLAARIAERGAAVIVSPPSLAATDRELAAPARLHAAGVPIAFGSDGRPGAVRLSAVLAHRAGLSREAALHALTAGAAAILGVENEGRLSAGARADFVLYDGDPLDLSARVLAVYIEGKVSE